MQAYFYTLADFIDQQLHATEIYLAEFIGEDSDFVRFNQAKVRQAGNVIQRQLRLNLIAGQRHALGWLMLSGDLTLDQARIKALLTDLRTKLPYLAEDPYLLYATAVQNSESLAENHLPQNALETILTATQGQDFVGLYAVGGIFRGFANTFGQRNWHSHYNFNLDWSFYHDKDKAVKSAYAGTDWQPAIFQDKIQQALTQLDLLKRPPHTISPGRYRVYLSPAALYEILQLLSWGGFSLKAQHTKQSPLLRLFDGQLLHTSITLQENIAQGIAPAFQAEGFIKPAHMYLIKNGHYDTALASPRSAQEYGVVTNGANNEESPVSLELAPGHLAQHEVLTALDTGIYINNLWYLNYSDRAACRITGMTRFATFWVEKGEIVAPLNVMRFDETIYHLLGDKLVDLTAEQDFIMSSDTYEARSVESARLPGALIEDFTLTL